MKQKTFHLGYIKSVPSNGKETTPPTSDNPTTNPLEETTTPAATKIQLSIPEAPPSQPMAPTIPTTNPISADILKITPIDTEAPDDVNTTHLAAEAPSYVNIIAPTIPKTTPLSA